ncbi:hypothetical protein BDB01DRAFT_779578 [Pilobolus umbonatus]|nr:hypothetical protein BDB01DRAFT_779578 [Pilobolus umbonatus]
MRFTLAFIAAALLAVQAAPASVSNMAIDANEFSVSEASPLSMMDTFETFHWRGELEAPLVDRAFLIDLAEPAELQLTDFMKAGDMYELMDNGVSLGMTSEVESVEESPYAATPEEAFLDARFSKASYNLEAGHHEITIKVANPLGEYGSGAVRLVQSKAELLEKRGDDSDSDSDCDSDDEDDDKNGKGGKGEEHVVTKTVPGKAFKKTVYVYYTVSPSASSSSGGPITTTSTTVTGTATSTVIESTTEIVSATSTATGLLNVGFLTI